MEINRIKTICDINRIQPTNISQIIHINDVNVRVIELEFDQDNERIEFDAGCTASASFVDKTTNNLIMDDISCEITENSCVLIHIDDLHSLGVYDIIIEVTVHDSANEQVLNTPYPIWIRINPSILESAKMTTDSLGTIPELLNQAKELIENFHYELSEEEKEDIAGLVDISGKENVINKKTEISRQSQTGDHDINYPTLGAVRDFVNIKDAEIEDYIDSELESIDADKADKATTLAGYNITDAYTKAEVNGMIPSVPTKVSDLTNDSGFLTLSTLPKYNGGVQ